MEENFRQVGNYDNDLLVNSHLLCWLHTGMGWLLQSLAKKTHETDKVAL